MWEDLVLGMIGEQFTYPDEICGIVINIKKKKNIISIWNKSGSDMEIRNTVRNDLLRLLGLPENTKMDYQKFNADDDM